MSSGSRPSPTSADPALRRAARLAGVLVLVAAAGASAQTPPAVGPSRGVGDVPTGEGRVRVQVVHPDDPEAAAGLDVALYSLAPDGRPGLRDARTDASGAAVFEGVSTTADVVYLVGARYRGVPFGQRITFPADSEAVEVVIEVSEPLADGSDVEVAEAELALDWLGDGVAVQELRGLSWSGDRVVFVPEATRDASQPAARALLPEGAERFSPALGSQSQGLTRRGRQVLFWGPVYPGTQELRWSWRLPTEGDETEDRELEIPWHLPSGARRVRVVVPEGGPAVEVAGLVEGEPVEREGRTWRVLEGGPVPAGGTLLAEVGVPAARRDPDAVSLSRSDLWIEVDDAAVRVTAEHHLEVEGSTRLVGDPQDPVLRFDLPEGAQLLGASPNASGLGLAPAPDGSGLVVVGPLPAGTTRLGFRYRMPARAADGTAELDLRFPRAVGALNVLVADTGVVVEDDRLHRLRPVRSGTRTYLRREAFQLEAGETVSLRIRSLQDEGPPRWAILAVVGLAGLGGIAWVLRPLRPSPESEPAGETPALRVRREREGVMDSIRDLDHDFETGKISEEDYGPLRASLRTRAVELLARERELAEPPAAPTAEAPAPQAVADRAVPADACPGCGARVLAGWHFCARCGTELDEAPPAAAGGSSGSGA